MTGCSPIRPLLVLHADGGLTPARRARVDRHLARCPACARVLGALGTGPLDFGAPRIDPPALDALKAAILERARPHPHPHPLAGLALLARRLFLGRLAIPKPLVWAAATVLLLVMAGDVPSPPSPESRVLTRGFDGAAMASLDLN